jgi:hypothetical protein
MAKSPPPRKTTCQVIVEVKCKEAEGEVKLELEADDEDTIYLKGSWKLLGRGLGEKVLKSKSGSFERRKDAKVLHVDAGGGNFISLEGVDSMHGLAYGGRGKAYFLKPPGLKDCKGPHNWTGVGL